MAASMWKYQKMRYPSISFKKLNYLWKRGYFLSPRICFSDKGSDSEDNGKKVSTQSLLSRLQNLKRESPLKTIPDSVLSKNNVDSGNLSGDNEVNISDETFVNEEQKLKSDKKEEGSIHSPMILAMKKFESLQLQETDDGISSNMSTISKDYENKSFSALLRQSKLMQMGEHSGSIIMGKIKRIIGDDLYIDFGGKFDCVCTRPEMYSEYYQVGTKVKLQLKDFEMTSAFLGSSKHITLLEADAVLLGLHSHQNRNQWIPDDKEV